MDIIPYIGICKVCNYGMLEINFDIMKNDCSIMCDECFAEWNNPEDALRNVNGFRESYKMTQARKQRIKK